MSDDLVKRLQDPPFGTETSERNLMAQAAAALVAKDAEIARLREALRGIAETSNYTRSEWMQERARSALLAEAEKVEAEDASDDDWKADLSLMQYNALKGKMP